MVYSRGISSESAKKASLVSCALLCSLCFVFHLDMEALCRTESSGAAVPHSVVELLMAETILAAEKVLLGLLLGVGYLSRQSLPLDEESEVIYWMLRRTKSEATPENRDDGESDDEGEDDNEEDEDAQEEDRGEEESSGEEGNDNEGGGGDGDGDDDPEVNGEGGSEEEDEDNDDDEEEEEEEEEDEEDEEDEDDEVLPPPPSKKRK